MEGVMNQLSQYNGPWELAASDNTCNKPKSKFQGQQAPDELLQDVSVDDGAVAERIGEVRKILLEMDAAENQRKLARRDELEKREQQLEAKMQQQRNQEKRMQQAQIVWTPQPPRRLTELLSKVDRRRKLEPEDHQAAIRQLHAVR